MKLRRKCKECGGSNCSIMDECCYHSETEYCKSDPIACSYFEKCSCTDGYEYREILDGDVVECDECRGHKETLKMVSKVPPPWGVCDYRFENRKCNCTDGKIPNKALRDEGYELIGEK